MSRAADTLLTTHNATFIHPRFMPGYRGYCPAVKYDFGETYGNQTAKYFHDYRSAVLTSSKSPYYNGGSFPTLYSHNPDLVLGNRSRTRDRWLYNTTYDLTNINHDRTEELSQYDTLVQKQREHYTDKTGFVYPVAHFSIPATEDELFKRNTEIRSFSNRHTDKLYLPPVDAITRRGPIMSSRPRRIPGPERAKRDQYHEQR